MVRRLCGEDPGLHRSFGALEAFSGWTLHLTFPVVPTVIKGIWDFDSWLDDVYSRCPRLGVDVVSSSRPRIIADDHLAGMYRNSVDVVMVRIRQHG